MKITEKKTETTITLVLEGRADTQTSPELQQKVLNAFQKKKLVALDFERVDYISSAGLRVLLMGHKTALSKGGKMELLNVTPAVMEILEMTGFKDMLKL